MSLEVGKQLGIYTVAGPLGAGGMGEVYRATDTKPVLQETVNARLMGRGSNRTYCDLASGAVSSGGRYDRRSLAILLSTPGGDLSRLAGARNARRVVREHWVVDGSYASASSSVDGWNTSSTLSRRFVKPCS